MAAFQKKRFEEWIADLVRRYRPLSGPVLDVGSGEGRVHSAFDTRVVGIDLLCARGVDAVASAEQLPFRDETFMFAISLQCYYYVPEIDKALSELHRVLQPDATVLVSLSNWYHLMRERKRQTGAAHAMSRRQWVRLYSAHGFVSEAISAPPRYSGLLSFLPNAASALLSPYNLYRLRRV